MLLQQTIDLMEPAVDKFQNLQSKALQLVVICLQRTALESKQAKFHLPCKQPLASWDIMEVLKLILMDIENKIQKVQWEARPVSLYLYQLVTLETKAITKTMVET